MTTPFTNLTYVVLGTLENKPTNGLVAEFPLANPDSQSLYEARKAAMLSVTTKYVCLLDGGSDRLLPGFEADVNSRLDKMDRNPQAALSYADERVGVTPGKLSGTFTLSKYLSNMPGMMHHGVILRTEVLKRLIWPEGCYWFEGVVYGAMAQLGSIYHPRVVYEWNPSPGGASTWDSVAPAMRNTIAWLKNRDIPKFEPRAQRPTLSPAPSLAVLDEGLTAAEVPNAGGVGPAVEDKAED
jgi:hypothetical protein